MIEVKGSKTQAQEDPAQRYVLKNEDKKSKTPAVLSAFLMGVALYLKSIFPSMAEPEDGKPVAEAEPNGEAEPQMALASTPERPQLDDAPTGTVAGADGPTGSGGDIIRPLPPVEYMIVESPEIDYAQYEVNVFPDNFKIPAFGAPANDNSGGGGSLPDIDFPDEDDDDDDTDPGDPTSLGEDDCPTGCDGDPCDEDPAEEPCGSDPCDDDPCGEDPCDDDPQSGNRAPRVAGPVYLMDVTGCAILAIGLTDLLRNAVDPGGDALSVQNLTVSSGTLTQEAGGWVFQGGPQLLGPVTITYQITDGEFTVAQTAHFSVVRSFIGGSDGDDMLLGTMCSDDIDGGDGDDNIDGRAGNDVIAGGNGDDHIVAGAGDDTVFGGVGDDIVFGGAGNDHISGGDGDDRLYGEGGDDIIFGGGGDDAVSGGDGDDLLSGGDGHDVVEGDAGDDIVDGGTGNDVVKGGRGNDTLLDGAGEDTVLAGTGDDRVVAAPDGDDDMYNGGTGCDMLDYSATTEGVAVDLAAGTAVGPEIGSDTVTAFEAVLGGSGGDTLTGSAAAETLQGNAGGDEISGGGGDDLLSDGEGEDAVHGGSGNDTVIAALDGDKDFYDGGVGCDTLDYSATSQGVTVDLSAGTACGVEIGEDTISGFEIVGGGGGDDCFIVGDEPAILVGGDGENTFEFLMAGQASGPAVHQILDFKVGDLIRMSKYDIFEEALDAIEDLFETVYGDDIDDDDIPIRFRHDIADEMMRTVIETDFDNDDIYETTISLQGHHVLVITEQA